MYDCGLSVSQLTIEAHHRGYVVHQMGGFDREVAPRTRKELSEIVIAGLLN